ncbi:MAG: tyrosine-type recombinase/integrase [Haloplanus sp.]
MNESAYETRHGPSEIDIPFALVPDEAREYLNDKQVFDYENRREKFARWLLLFGKRPESVEGYAEATARRTMYRVGYFERWVWQNEGEYVPLPTHEHADAYVQDLAFADYTNSHKAGCQHALKRYFRWRAHEHGDEEWEPQHTFSQDNSNKPRDYLSLEERQKIRQVALEYGDMPYYQNYEPDERERMKPYVAERVGKPMDLLTRDDWNGLTSWKFTSLVWTSLDAGLRPIEVSRATTKWVDTENAVLRIPADESSKNRDNWVVSVREDTAKALGKWLEERRHIPMYDDTDTLWLTQKGNPYKPQSLRRLLHRLCDRAGIEYGNRTMSWYAIRHSVGTYMTREEDLAATQAQLRHKNPMTTMKYDAAPPGARRDALDRMG